MKIYSVGDITLEISDAVLEIFELFVQDTKKKNESGGILLGQVVDKHIYVLRASIPTGFDKASRYGFERSKHIAQIIVDHEFINSGNKTIYLGEWHTHPEDHSSPSPQDKKMISDQLRLNQNIQKEIFLVIRGISTLYVGVYNGKVLTKMTENKKM